MLAGSSNARQERRHQISGKSRTDAVPDPRTEYQRDRDRILYSSAFRRLSGITQVASPTELYLVHNRLTHTLKVAQVARSLARYIIAGDQPQRLIDLGGGLDLDAVESAALAHDLGHPPFGHVAEKTLDRLLVDRNDEHDVSVADGFDGNAQSFRIVTKLAVQQQGSNGLDLTRATLNGLLKYPWRQSADPTDRRTKWGVFETELDDFYWCTTGVQSRNGVKTLEAAIMDWADDITYAVHDAEDFFRAGLIPLERFADGKDEQAFEFFLDDTCSRRKWDNDRREALKAAFRRTEVFKRGLPGPFRGSQTDREALRTITSALIHRYVSRAITLAEGEHGVELNIEPGIQDEVTILKELTWTYVIESTAMVAQRFGHRTLIESLFRTFYAASMSDDDQKILPQFYRDEIERAGNDKKLIKRIVADLISSMSEAQVVAIHQRLTGQSLGSAMDAYLQ